MFANTLEIKNGEIVGYKLREPDGKIGMINRFKEAGLETIAIGDSFNDLKMLKGAEYGIIFRGSPKLLAQEKDLPSAENYEELKKILEKILWKRIITIITNKGSKICKSLKNTQKEDFSGKIEIQKI